MKNVLELKTKKMSLANIEGRLTPEEMENVMAGSNSVITAVNIACVGIGLAGLAGSVFTFGASVAGALTIGGAFCTGWGIGSLTVGYVVKGK